MRRLSLLLAAVVALGAAGEHADTHPPTGVTERREAGALHYEAVVPGDLLGWAAPATAGGRLLFLLAAPEDAPEGRRSLYHLDLGSRSLTLLRSDLDPEIDRMAAIDLDADGSEDLVLGAPGRLLAATPTPSGGLNLRPLVRASGLDLAAAVPRHGQETRVGHLAIPTVGRLLRFAPAPAGWAAVASLALPTTASRHGRGLRLTSPPTTHLTLSDGDLYAVGPEPVGERRLRTTLLPADGGEARVAWSRLPGAERLQWSWLTVLDGRPVLVVTTNSADKLAVLERQGLRVFALYDDRTRAGVGPWVVAETASRRWQRVEPFVTDIDGDRDQDLIVAQVGGLGSGELVVEAFANSGRRGFEAERRRFALDRAAAGWHVGSDLTGDGLPDLVVVSDGEIAVYEGTTDRRRLFARRPRWSVGGPDIPRSGSEIEIGDDGAVVRHSTPAADPDPHLLDLDGDGRDEILLADRPQWGFARLRVVVLLR